MVARSDPNAKTQRPRPRHVLMIAERATIQRLGRMLWQVSVALTGEGTRVTIVTDDPQALNALEDTPIECILVKRFAGWSIWRLPIVLSRRLQPLPDVIHFWDLRAWRSLFEWALTNDMVMLGHVHSLRDVHRLSPRDLRPGTHIAVGCRGLHERLNQRFGRDVACDVLAPVFLMPDDDRAPSDGDHTRGVLWMGRMDDRCGLNQLIQAVAQLQDRLDLHVALVGSGPRQHVYYQRMKAMNVLPRFSMVDSVRHWDRAIRGADALVVPGVQEELTLAPLFAMATGRIVTAVRGQVADWFIDNETVWSFDSGRSDALAQRLMASLEPGEQRDALRASAKAYVQRRHTVSAFVLRLLAVYERMLIEARAAPPAPPAAEEAGTSRPGSTTGSETS